MVPLRLSRKLDYEDDHTYPLVVEVSDEHGFVYQRIYHPYIECGGRLDGDEIEDHYDYDDDGDGFSDEDELENNLNLETNTTDPNLLLFKH